jgi:hypothetical protein
LLPAGPHRRPATRIRRSRSRRRTRPPGEWQRHGRRPLSPVRSTRTCKLLSLFHKRTAKAGAATMRCPTIKVNEFLTGLLHFVAGRRSAAALRIRDRFLAKGSCQRSGPWLYPRLSLRCFRAAERIGRPDPMLFDIVIYCCEGMCGRRVVARASW